jgi:hypothetical protein
VNDGRELSCTLKDAVTGLGGSFMVSPEAKAAGKDGGYRGWALYMGGRAGVLGDAPVPVVSAALGFFEPGMVRTNWELARAVAPVADTLQRYAEMCRSWGRTRWASMEGVDRLCSLLAVVVDRVEPAGLPLFAGWRDLPLPDEGAARAAQLLQTLREHRGGSHLMATRAVGLHPLEAILSGSGGAGNARFFGWTEGYPEVDDAMRSRRAEAERLTTEMVAPAYAALRTEEAADVVDLLATAQQLAKEHAA